MNSRDEYDPNLVRQFFTNDYHDRGMKKWQGFFLSDHTSSLSKMDHNDYEQRRQSHQMAMEPEDIADVINEAVVKNQQVAIDLAERTVNGIIPKPIIGRIQGWFGEQLFVNDKPVLIEEIYAIKKV